MSSGGLGCVEVGHEFAVGGSCGGEFLVAFLKSQPQVDDLLFEEDDLLFEHGCCIARSLSSREPQVEVSQIALASSSKAAGTRRFTVSSVPSS